MSTISNIFYDLERSFMNAAYIKKTNI